MSINFNLLDKALKKMGGDLKHFPIEKIESNDEIIIEKLKEGIEISYEDFDKIETIAGLFSWKNEHAFLYIHEPIATEEELLETPSQSGPKFHLLKCSTILDMHKKNRSKRYKLIRATEGNFPCYPRLTNPDGTKNIHGKINYNNKIFSDLIVCQNCLSLLNYRNFRILSDFRKKRKFARSFEKEKFFKYYNPFFFDQKYYNKDLKKDGNYTLDHALVRDKLLKKVSYCCQNKDCFVDLNDHPEWLHMHHINGQRGDNDETNLKILCILCHQKQPFHQKMRVPPKARTVILKRRKKN